MKTVPQEPLCSRSLMADGCGKQRGLVSFRALDYIDGLQVLPAALEMQVNHCYLHLTDGEERPREIK